MLAAVFLAMVFVLSFSNLYTPDGAEVNIQYFFTTMPCVIPMRAGYNATARYKNVLMNKGAERKPPL